MSPAISSYFVLIGLSAVAGLGKDYSADDQRMRDFLKFYSDRVALRQWAHSQDKPMQITTILPDVKPQPQDKGKPKKKKNVATPESLVV